MRRPLRGNKALQASRAIALLAAGLAMAALALFAIGGLSTNPAAGSSNPATSATVLAASLSVSPINAVPNQSIALIGSGFTTSFTAGGAGPNGVHQITGVGTSFVRVAGIILSSAQITYPINLDSSGSLVVTTAVPVNATTLTGGSHTADVTDDQGVTASATLTILQRVLAVSPDTGRRGSIVTATGTGFPASNPRVTGSFPVNINYAGTVVARVTPDSSGSFVVTFEVPLSAATPSTNTVTASTQSTRFW